MRLKRLDLARYGRFTNHSIDFGERLSGRPDLHVVYGPNEAGKSTLFAAWLDLLYGIDKKSRYQFLHPYATMRIGGVLEMTAGAREYVRVGQPQNSLLDAHGLPIGETAILGELGGIDRSAYRTMFSLDDHTLKEGGESILRARGDLGQLLFSGSSGLADLSRKIMDLHCEAGEFYRSHARSGQLHGWQSELIRLKQEREQYDTQASKHAEFSEAAKRAKDRYEEMGAKRRQLAERRDAIQRLLDAQPRLAKLRTLQEKLAPLADLPDAPARWAQELPALRDEEIKLETQIRLNDMEVERLTLAIEAITLDDAALRLAGKLDEIAPLHARYLTAEKDLPDRRQKMRELDLAIAHALRKIEREKETNPDRLIVPASTAERLRELSESYSGIALARDKAAEELTDARHRLDMAACELATSAGNGSATMEREQCLTALKEALAAFRASDHGARRRLFQRACLEAQEALDERLAALAPWREDMDELATMLVPGPETLERWKLTQEAIQTRIDQHRAEIDRLRTECARLFAQLDAVSGAAGLPTDEEAAAMRAERDHAWAQHRARLDAASADRFEELLRRDDEVVARRFGHMAELAELQNAAKALKISQSGLARAEELQARSRAEEEDLAREIASAIGALSPLLPSSWTLPQLSAWLSRRENALQARNILRKAQRDLQQAQADARDGEERLAAALRAMNTPVLAGADEAALVAAAQNALDQEARIRLLHQALEERQRDVSARERALERAEASAQKWHAAWKEICESCWLGASGAVPAIAAVRGLLKTLAELASDLKERAALSDRIEKMEKDQAVFCNAVASLADGLGIAQTTPFSATEVARQIEQQIRKAESGCAQKAKEQERLESLRAISLKLNQQKLAHDHRKREMTAHFGVATFAALAAKLDQVAMRENLRKETAEVTQEILGILRAASLHDAQAMLEAADPAALEAELADITAQAENLEQDWHESYHAYKDARKQIDAIGGDAKVAEIEEQRRTILLQIEEGAGRYMRLRAGAVAVELALRLYRERHRSSMLARASEALRIISRGTYTRLATQPDKDSEILVAIAADKGSKTVADMSRGTSFQLYLALRVAGFFEFAKTRSPVPFVADDIMETFDDFRAEEAFRLFAQMAQIGQVIYLTHHRHLCEIAREVCATVHVHELPSAPAPERVTV